MDEAIRVSGVSKRYRLGRVGYGTLQADLQSGWARLRGREDPNQKLGTTAREGDFLALDDVSLTVRHGETVGLIGRNGAGKSTLLKLLSRVTAPTAGEIELVGRVSSLLEVGTGFHPQMTGRENVFLNGAILGLSKKEIRAQLDSIIEFSEVGEFIDTPVKRYSSGMRVKLGFAVAAQLRCEIMLMDEVLAVGDAAFKAKCLGRLREVAREDGRTVIYVSHDLESVKTLCARCLVLDKGRLVFDGPSAEAVAFYLGRSEP